jgi:hypothetical protein
MSSMISNELVGYVLVEQIEAVSQLERQFSGFDKKTVTLENEMKSLQNKLEETISLFENFMITSTNMSSRFNTDKNKEEREFSKNCVKDELPRVAFSTLCQLGSSLYEQHDKTSLINNANNSVNNIPNKMQPDFCLKKIPCCLYCSRNNNSSTPIFYEKSQMENHLGHYFERNDEQSYQGIRQEFKEVQRLFNKRVKYEVNRKFGINYLAEHQVRQLDIRDMHNIKKKVIKIFSPFPVPIKIAWNNAMNSLRQDRHQLKKQKLKRKW